MTKPGSDDVWVYLLNRNRVMSEVFMRAQQRIAEALNIADGAELRVSVALADDGGLMPQVEVPKYVDLDYADPKIQAIMGSARLEVGRSLTGLRQRRICDAPQAT